LYLLIPLLKYYAYVINGSDIFLPLVTSMWSLYQPDTAPDMPTCTVQLQIYSRRHETTPWKSAV